MLPIAATVLVAGITGSTVAGLLGVRRARELSLTGNFLDAAKAYEWGLVNRVVAPNELMPAALELAAQMADIEGDMLVTYKAMIDDGYDLAMGIGIAQGYATVEDWPKLKATYERLLKTFTLPEQGTEGGTWARAQALSLLAWMNNTVHPTFTHIFRSEDFAESESAKAEVKRLAAARFRKYLERIQEHVKSASPFWFGARITPHDAYAFTFLRWGGFGGIDPASLPAYRAHIERVMAAPPVAAALERERIKLDTYKAAA